MGESGGGDGRRGEYGGDVPNNGRPGRNHKAGLPGDPSAWHPLCTAERELCCENFA